MKIFFSNAAGIFLGMSLGSFVFFHMFDSRMEKMKKDFHTEIKKERDETILHFKSEINSVVYENLLLLKQKVDFSEFQSSIKKKREKTIFAIPVKNESKIK